MPGWRVNINLARTHHLTALSTSNFHSARHEWHCLMSLCLWLWSMDHRRVSLFCIGSSFSRGAMLHVTLFLELPGL